MVSFCCARGLMTTHSELLSNGKINTNPRAGEDYDTFDWDQLRYLLHSPLPPPKNESYWAIFSTEHGPDARRRSVQVATGEYHALVIDMDKGSMSKPELIYHLQRIVGPWRMYLYTTASATVNNLRWRVIIPLDQPIGAVTYEFMQRALNNFLAPVMECDRRMERCSQIMFLPVAGPAYDWAELEGPSLLVATHPIVERAYHLYLVEIETEFNKRGSDATEDKSKHLIRLFNKAYPLAYMLPRYGFETLDDINYRHPSQTSASYGTIVWNDKDKAFTQSSTVAAMVGKEYFDSLDLFAAIECDRDFKLAITCAKAMPYGWQIAQHPSEAEQLLYARAYEGWDMVMKFTCCDKPLNPAAAQQKEIELVVHNQIAEENRARIAEQEALKLIAEAEWAAREKLVVEPFKMMPLAEGEWNMPWPPGRLGVIARYIYQNSRKPIVQYALTFALFGVAAIVQRRYLYSNAGLNLYFAVGGRSGTGKGQAKGVVDVIMSDICTKCNNDLTLITDVMGNDVPASGQALKKMFADGLPQKAVYQDDADPMFSNMTATEGNGQTLKSAVLSLWDKGGRDKYQGKIRHSASKDTVDLTNRPALTLALDTQLPTLRTFLGSASAFSSGIGARIIFIEYDGLLKYRKRKGRKSREEQVLQRDIPPLDADVFNPLKGIWEAIMANPEEVIEVDITDEALAVDDDFDDRMTDKMNAMPDSIGYANRATMNIVKVAAIMAVLENPQQPVITLEQWTWARDFAIKGIDRVLQLVEDGETGAIENTREAQAVKAIREYKTMQRHTREGTYKIPSSISHNPEIIPHKYLMHRLKLISAFKEGKDYDSVSKRIEKVIEQLLKDNVLATITRATVETMAGNPLDIRVVGKFYQKGPSWD